MTNTNDSSLWTFQDFERGKIADVMESKKFKENDIIIKQVNKSVLFIWPTYTFLPRLRKIKIFFRVTQLTLLPLSTS